MTRTAPAPKPITSRPYPARRTGKGSTFKIMFETRPAFDLHYPHLVERARAEGHVGRRAHPTEVAAQGVGKEHRPDDDPRSV